MILVDVYVPPLEEAYDLMLDENTQVSKLAVQIVEVLVKKYRLSFPRSDQPFSLASRMQKRILPPQETLSSCGIRSGSSLILL